MKTILLLWQAPQILLGLLIVFCLAITRSLAGMKRYKNAVVYRYRPGRYVWGVSLGPVIVLADHPYHDETVVRHEYGHSLQSRILGPLYLIVVGLPSITMNILTVLRVLDQDRYYDRWPESWADRLGGVERVPT